MKVRHLLWLALDFALIFGTLALAPPVSARGVEKTPSSEFGIWNEVPFHGLPPHPEDLLLASGQWFGNAPCAWAVTETQDIGEAALKRTLTIYPRDKKAAEAASQLSYETIDSFVGAIPLRDASGDLLTVWTGGSAYHVVVFGLTNGKPRIVWERGMRGFPQLAYVNDDGRLDILVRSEESGDLKVYQRTEGGYQESGGVQLKRVSAKDLS